jgi:hypothetical protein
MSHTTTTVVVTDSTTPYSPHSPPRDNDQQYHTGRELLASPPRESDKHNNTSREQFFHRPLGACYSRQPPKDTKIRNITE